MARDSIDLLELLRKQGMDGGRGLSTGGAESGYGCADGSRSHSEDRCRSAVNAAPTG